MRRVILCAVVVLVGATGRTLSQDVYLAGTVDAFALPADPALPSSELVAIDPSGVGQPFQDFDLIAGVNGGKRNHVVGHTFSDLPSRIVGATLELRVQAGELPNSDGILFSFVDAQASIYLDTVAFARTFGQFPGGGPGFLFPDPDPGLLVSDEWSEGDDEAFTLDCAFLPLADGGTLSLIPQLNTHGFLDVIVSDETGVDYYRLTLTTVPEPSTLILLAISAVGLLAFARRRRRA